MGRPVMLSCCDCGTKVSMFERDSRLTVSNEEQRKVSDSLCRLVVSTSTELEDAGTAVGNVFNWSICHVGSKRINMADCLS